MLNSTRRYDARRAAKKFGSMLTDVQDQPIEIFRYGRPCAVIMDFRLFKQYQSAYEAAVEERYLSLLENALDHMAEGKIGRGDRTLALARRVLNDSEES